MTRAYHALRSELLRFLIARVSDVSIAEELLQDLWVKLQARDSGPVANARSYLYRACQNLVLDRVRNQSRDRRRETEWMAQRTRVGGDEPGDLRPTAEEEIIAREDAAALASAIAALPEAAGRAFRLHKIDGLSHADVAARLGISRSGVEKHMAVAMAHLRRALRN